MVTTEWPARYHQHSARSFQLNWGIPAPDGPDEASIPGKLGFPDIPHVPIHLFTVHPDWSSNLFLPVSTDAHVDMRLMAACLVNFSDGQKG